MEGLLKDPYKMSMILNGLGLLGSKYEDQSSRYMQNIQSGLMQQSRLNQTASEKKENREFLASQKQSDREFDSPYRKAQIDYLKAQTGGEIADANAPSGLFGGGTGFGVNSGNLIAQIGAKIKKNEPLTTEEEVAYRYALSSAAKGQVFTDASGKSTLIPGIDVNQFPQLQGQGLPENKLLPETLPIAPQPIAQPAPSVLHTPKSTTEKEVDKKYAADYLEWNRGGFSDAKKSISSLKIAIDDLESGKTKTGGAASVADNILPDSLVGYVAPDFKNTKDLVEEQVQRNLRLILGAQFTEQEGKRLIERAYNPSLPTEKNVQRLKALVDQIESAAEAKQTQAEYYESTGSLKGYKGPTFTKDDFDPDQLYPSASNDDEYEALKKKYLQ